MQPWVENAMKNIFGSMLFEMKDWIIDLQNVPRIAYYELNDNSPKLGGGWQNPTIERVIHRSSFYPFHRMQYKKALRRTKKNKRRRGYFTFKQRSLHKC